MRRKYSCVYTDLVYTSDSNACFPADIRHVTQISCIISAYIAQQQPIISLLINMGNSSLPI